MSEIVEPSILGTFAEPSATRAHYAARLAFETDPSDVAAAIAAGERVQLVDVRGRAAWNQGHAASAVHLPRAELLDHLDELDPALPIVVMCWGPACNGGAKAAHALAGAGLRVKELLGGFEYWAREGLPVESADGHVHRDVDPLTAPVLAAAELVAPVSEAGGIRCDC